MSRVVWFALGAVTGVAVGFGTGYLVVSAVAKQRIIGGGRDLVGKLGGGTTVQDMIGSALTALVNG